MSLVRCSNPTCAVERRLPSLKERVLRAFGWTFETDSDGRSAPVCPRCSA